MKARVMIAMASGILGGPGKGVAQFLRHGGLRGCSPVVINYHTEDDPDPPETEYVRNMRATGAILEHIRQKRTFDPGLVTQGLELIKKHGINLLQSHGYKSHVLCWLLKRKTGLPWVSFIHGWTRENMKMRLYNGIDKWMPLASDRVVAVSESVRERLPGPVRKKCSVIANAVSLDEFSVAPDAAHSARARLNFPERAVIFGVVGRLSPEKGQHVFLRALAKARLKNKNLYGLLVGDGPERLSLERERAALGLDGKCAFTGYVVGPGAYYRSMDVQVMPSFTEGMPNAALEGMLMGLPILASRAGGIPEVILDGVTGKLLPPGDADALAESMQSLAESPELRANMGEAGKRRAQEAFTPEARVKSILKLYDGLLGLKQKELNQ